MSIILDNWGRKIDYLRISVTDRCNLRCTYCMPKEGIKCTPDENLLSLEEMLRIAKIAAELGISKIRITGGEPLVRKGIESFIKDLKHLPGIKEVCLTTNGILLEEKVDELIESGLDTINISLDTMKENLYKDITLYGNLDKVLKGIEQSISKGLKVKLNTVIMEGVNDSEIMDFVKLTEAKPVDLRFIELMPIGEGKKFNSFSADRIKNVISEERQLIACESRSRRDGPAEYYKTFNGIGRIGFISAVSHNFCGECNRIRLTCKGFFKQCLFLNTGKDLKSLIRAGITDQELKEIMEAVIKNKPQDRVNADSAVVDNRDGSFLNDKFISRDGSFLDDKFMNEIGG